MNGPQQQQTGEQRPAEQPRTLDVTERELELLFLCSDLDALAAAIRDQARRAAR
ncbi:hypothetical protein ACWGI8_05900 [Streptomyces sp. NPDC054841]